MKIVLATGIYPPDIGGPATYVRHLAEEFTKMGMEVVVITYGESSKVQVPSSKWEVVRVNKSFPILRWFRYAKALKKVGKDADVVYVFSSVSVGAPLEFARLKKPKKVLRLGGDFGWERYTDWGGRRGLREWYAKSSLVSSCWFLVYRWILSSFHHIVFSTKFQEEIYENKFKQLPAHSVVENALPEGQPEMHSMNAPLRILFMGRFVAFKNLETFLKAIDQIDARVTMVGDGPKNIKLKKLASPKVVFVSPTSGEEKQKIFQSHDLMVIPSITEISPNVALEARATGLPVLLSSETGLSTDLSEGMILKNLRREEDIVSAIENVRSHYVEYSKKASESLEKRGWDVVAGEHGALFEQLI
ncbi:MAG: glycosyltransferase family 4 protein [Kiritimatiellales bacterium]|nr:glycosyltransferase family 4 protein [Kiritimatiellales bacterium]